MSAATTDFSALDSYQTELTVLRGRRVNVLLEGPVAATTAVLRLLPPFREAVVWHPPPAPTPLELPTRETRVLVLKNVAALNGTDQIRLRDWLGGGGSRPQIVSTTQRPLFALVTRGLFDEVLYYRLNVILLRVRSPTLA